MFNEDDLIRRYTRAAGITTDCGRSRRNAQTLTFGLQSRGRDVGASVVPPYARLPWRELLAARLRPALSWSCA
jgi:hypothetical protein